MNVFTFTGNLGGDAETRYTASGTAVASFSVAVKSGYGDKEKTTWVRCALFGKRAEGGLIQYLKKGTQVAVSGEASLNEYTANDGTPRASLDVRVNDVTLIGGKPERQAEPSTPSGGGDFDDDLPFAPYARRQEYVV